MKKNIDFERVLFLVDEAISPTYLNQTQEIVLREVWNGKTYTKMAYDYNYDPEYIKTVGCNLWQTLSRAFDEQINKSNFVPFMRRKVGLLTEEAKKDDVKDVKELNLGVDSDPCREQVCRWTTAPDVKQFFGRQQEIETLSGWSQDPDCRLIVVSGMTGAGKTTLVTKFASSIKDRFDYIIWFSLSQRPSLSKLLNKYLSIINHDCQNENTPKELSFLLSEFICCLREHRVLLVLDGLQCILEVNQNSVSYRPKFEGYGQFLRSIISTDHQSLLVTTSRVKPKILKYYASNQVRFLNLKGFDNQTTISFLNACRENSVVEEKLLQLSKKLQHNPQLLKIANNYLEGFSEDSVEQILENLSLIEAICDLLEQELSYLAPLEQEILYWLAISCDSISATDLKRQIQYSQSKLKFNHSLKSLSERSLITKNDQNYALMPIMKLYLRRKLVKQAI